MRKAKLPIKIVIALAFILFCKAHGALAGSIRDNETGAITAGSQRPKTSTDIQK